MGIKHENTQMAVSYGIGAFSAMLAALPQIASVAQQIAIILGCIVVAVRLAHDTTRLYDYWKSRKHS